MTGIGGVDVVGKWGVEEGGEEEVKDYLEQVAVRKLDLHTVFQCLSVKTVNI